MHTSVDTKQVKSNDLVPEEYSQQFTNGKRSDKSPFPMICPLSKSLSLSKTFFLSWYVCHDPDKALQIRVIPFS